MNDRSSIPGMDRCIIFFVSVSSPAPPPIQWAPGALRPEIKLPVCEAECVELYRRYPVHVHGVVLS